MKTYEIEYAVSDKNGTVYSLGTVILKGKSKKDTIDFMKSKRFLQLEDGSKITIKYIVVVPDLT